jgi:hypothetical protein
VRKTLLVVGKIKGRLRSKGERDDNDERLEALTRNLELLSLESEKHDRQLDWAAKLVTEIAEGTARLLASCGDART